MNGPFASRSRGPFRFGPTHASALALGLLSLGAAACVRADGDEEALDDSVAAASAPLIRTGSELEKVELVFESRIQHTEDDEIVKSEVTGDLTVEQRDRVARPYRYVDEGVIYSEEAWSRGGENGVTERGYRVWKQRNRTPLDIHARTSAPPKVNDNVTRHVASAAPEDTLELDIKLRNFPEWNVPLAPATMDMSAADIKAHEERRAGAIREREALFDRMAADAVAQVEALGGRVKVRHKKSGWLGITVPASGFEALARNTALDRIDGPYGKTGGPDWSLGTGRQAEYLDADRFHAAGYTGEEPNPARHSYGDIVIGMNETGGYESGACAFKEGAGCTGASRIAATYRCDDSNDNDGNLCEPGTVETNFCDADGKCTDGHGTATTAVAIGDYLGGQANGKALGDPNFGSSACSSSAQCNGQPCEGGLCAHSTAWETARTGMAPEAKAVLFGIVKSGATSASLTDMFDDSVDLNLDISSNSWGWGDTNCDMQADTALKQQIEIAYDDGILPVFSAGNMNGDDATTCQIRDPADLPKVLTINAYDSATTDCTNNPSTRCLLDKVNCPNSAGDILGCSARGGADVQVAGRGLRTDAVSIVDLVAPNHISGVTWASSGTGTDGNPYGGFNGTSAAAPHVSGLAALVKSWYLNQGQSWVNLPGRLHTIMLAMGDRHFSSDPTSATTWTTQIAATPNDWYGVGRARLRLLESTGGLGNWGNHFTTLTFTGQTTTTYYPFGKDPLPSGIELVKCVAMQAEGMTNKSDISEIKLSVRVLPNATGTSCTGTSTATRISDNFDTKKVAALQGFSFTNQCVEVQIEAENVTTQGVTVNAMCYYAGINDDESL
ncbi:S8 family serine peptidase [Polyangium aurulentum]|uniref:S8 family serine peptidase n=1 Tax=Polyangium aurulentum TaxID=2567896 RepID=UPI00146EF426|nr:S8 family serine peptidase [Polyangium aurulentum]UQA58961.1 S8 family serine peptidase [Polyangium aurulentum]